MKKTAIIIVGLLLVLIPGGVIFAGNLVKAPLDPPLALDIPAEVQVAEAPSGESGQQGERTCGNAGKMSLIQIGVASPVAEGHPGADMIRLVVVDFDQVTADILPLPADLWVDTPEELLDELDYFAPLNQIYLAALESAAGNSEQVRIRKATQVLVQAILDEFEFVPDKYIAINGDAFIDLVDVIGGVEITLATEIDGGIHGVFPAGDQYLDGQRTLEFVKILYPNGVGPDYFGRFERQNMVIFALLDEILEPENWDEADDLLKEARKMVVTDLSVDQVRDLACMVEEVDGDANLIDVTPEMVPVDGEGRMVASNELRELIQQLQEDSE